MNTALYAYVCCVLYFTLMPVLAALPGLLFPPFGTVDFVPFSDLLHGRGDAVRQIMLNVLLTAPFGFLLPMARKGADSALKATGYTFLFSLCIECLQPLLHGYRAFDVTDLVTNTAGGALGYGGCRLARRVDGKYRKEK